MRFGQRGRVWWGVGQQRRKAKQCPWDILGDTPPGEGHRQGSALSIADWQEDTHPPRYACGQDLPLCPPGGWLGAASCPHMTCLSRTPLLPTSPPIFRGAEDSDTPSWPFRGRSAVGGHSQPLHLLCIAAWSDDASASLSATCFGNHPRQAGPGMTSAGRAPGW